ncbi:bark storage protein A-like isoform X2 [Actinidia eriantha]|uniref:bark storage protein A-like isoform X2 n=1 Tax=Actinidia eriantha TaxID=165200 RepID=UPI0025850084|nr:bark storage protein A-like isoform X2 [Actinidia eriantha]
MAEIKCRPCLVVLILMSSLAFPLAATSLRRRKSLETIKSLNQNGPYLGLITVYPPEEDAFFSTGAFKHDPKLPFVDLSGRRYRVGKLEGKKVIYVRCGVGMKQNGTLGTDDVAHLDIGSYNVPKNRGINMLGRIGYSNEQFFSESGNPNTAQPLLWARISQNWLNLAANLEGMKLEQCVNSSLCLPQKPKLVVGLWGSTANIFVDNADYREFLFNTFHVSSVDMESSAVVMTSLSNGFAVIVIRGLSDLAGGQPGKNSIDIFGPLAALNTAKVVIQFVKTLP